MSVSEFLTDAQDRGNSEGTIYKRRFFSRSFVSVLSDQREFGSYQNSISACCENGEALGALTSLVRAKRQGQVLRFLWFCERAGWLLRNYAADITKGLGKIRVKPVQTGYFTPTEYKALLDATYLHRDRPSVDRHKDFTLGGDRIRALTELMRWKGLRIRDAVTIEKKRLQHDPQSDLWSVMVYPKKTGDPVYCPIPPDVAEMLINVPASQKGNTNETYFFWTGVGKPKTIVSNWQRSYTKQLAALKESDGEPKRSFPHMLRDTFAVEALLSGMRLEEVSTILGHSSVKVTAKHYMPWVRARQSNLNQSVVQSWIKQGIVIPSHESPEPSRSKKTPMVSVPAAVRGERADLILDWRFGARFFGQRSPVFGT